MKKSSRWNWGLAVVAGVLAVQFAIPAALAGPTKNCCYINNSHKPYYSIQEAVNYARSGDTIWICEGTYYESVYIDYKNLKLKGWTDDCHKVVIKPYYDDNGAEPVGVEENGGGSNNGINVYDADYVVIKNLTVEGASNRGIEIDYVYDVEIEDVCVVDNYDDGINITEADYVTLCEIHAYDNGDDGIDVNDGGDVYACDIASKKNYGDGFDVDTACNVEIEDSYFMYNEEDGLDFDDVGNVDNGDVQATSGYNGSDCGLIKLRRVWSEYNYYSGLNVDCSGDVDLKDGNFNKNDDDGINCAGIMDLYIKSLNATHNGNDGLDIDVSECNGYEWGADDICIDYAEFSFNGEEGIDIEYVDEVKIEWVSANENGDDGLCIEYAYLLDVYYAEFSQNDDDGIDADCVYDIYLDDVWAKHNYDDGVAVNLDYGYGQPSVDENGFYCYTDYVCITNSNMSYNYGVGIYLEMVYEVKIKNTETKRNGQADRIINQGGGVPNP